MWNQLRGNFRIRLRVRLFLFDTSSDHQNFFLKSRWPNLLSLLLDLHLIFFQIIIFCRHCIRILHWLYWEVVILSSLTCCQLEVSGNLQMVLQSGMITSTLQISRQLFFRWPLRALGATEHRGRRCAIHLTKGPTCRVEITMGFRDVGHEARFAQPALLKCLPRFEKLNFRAIMLWLILRSVHSTVRKVLQVGAGLATLVIQWDVFWFHPRAHDRVLIGPRCLWLF